MSRTPRFIVIQKPLGQTPLEAIQVWKRTHPQFAEVPATYAGRLDPMASGKLIVLFGEECKKRDEYTGCDKEYEIEVVLDIKTDTGDALGLADISTNKTVTTYAALRAALSTLTGTHTLPYPPFSSKTVNGKPLFLYSLEGTLDSIEIPTHDECIYSIHTLTQKTLSKEELGDRITYILSQAPLSLEPSKKLGADFRQDDVRSRWEREFKQVPERDFSVLTLRVTCASGTYMRTLAERIGKELGTTGFALSITRTKIGRYLKFGPWGVWCKQYR